MEHKEYGNVGAVKPSDHPEIRKRKDEIVKLRDDLCQEEIEIACLQFAEKKWHRLRLLQNPPKFD